VRRVRGGDGDEGAFEVAGQVGPVQEGELTAHRELAQALTEALGDDRDHGSCLEQAAGLVLTDDTTTDDGSAAGEVEGDGEGEGHPA
jgi:hypothetical protein